MFYLKISASPPVICPPCNPPPCPPTPLPNLCQNDILLQIEEPSEFVSSNLLVYISKILQYNFHYLTLNFVFTNVEQKEECDEFQQALPFQGTFVLTPTNDDSLIFVRNDRPDGISVSLTLGSIYAESEFSKAYLVQEIAISKGSLNIAVSFQEIFEENGDFFLRYSINSDSCCVNTFSINSFAIPRHARVGDLGNTATMTVTGFPVDNCRCSIFNDSYEMSVGSVGSIDDFVIGFSYSANNGNGNEIAVCVENPPQFLPNLQKVYNSLTITSTGVSMLNPGGGPTFGSMSILITADLFGQDFDIERIQRHDFPPSYIKNPFDGIYLAGSDVFKQITNRPGNFTPISTYDDYFCLVPGEFPNPFGGPAIISLTITVAEN